MPKGIKYGIGYQFGDWTVVERQFRSNKIKVRCVCGYEDWKFSSTLVSGRSTKCRNCLFTSPQHRTFMTTKGSVRGAEWTITEEQWLDLSQKNCFYCGSEPQNVISGFGFKYNGLDRVVPGSAYTVDNVVPCCKICNRAKSNMTQDDFLAWVERVYSHGKSTSSK